VRVNELPFGLGDCVESKPRDLGSDRGYRVADRRLRLKAAFSNETEEKIYVSKLAAGVQVTAAVQKGLSDEKLVV
jgi:hypothetical protein